MTDTTRLLAPDHLFAPDLPPAMAVLAGAVLGGLGGFLFLTSSGARARHDIAAATARLFAGLDSALAGWARLQQHAAAMRPGRPIVDAASRHTSRSGIPIQ